MKFKKTHIYTIIAVIVLIALWMFFKTPEYDHPVTPKPLLGGEDAQLVITEFSDLQCPFCKRAHEESLKILQREFEGKIAFEFKHFPITTIHPMAFKAAEASECANDQGKFWPFIDAVYANQAQLSMSQLRIIAQNLELDMDSFNACLDSGAKAQIVQMEQRMGGAQGVSSTPTFILNGEKIDDWRYAAFKAKILAALGEDVPDTPAPADVVETPAATDMTEDVAEAPAEDEQGSSLLAVTR